MAPLKRLIGRLIAFWRPSRAERELEREVASHLALLEADFRGRGLSEADAQVAARRALGGIDQTKEGHRDARSLLWLEDLRRDVPYALRGLRRAPGFTTAAIITLALGIGSTTAVVSVVDTILVEPLPYADSDRLVRIVEHIPSRPSGRPPSRRALSRDELLEWQRRTQTLAGMAGAQWTPNAVMPTSQGVVRLSGALVTRDYLPLLGTQAFIGRTLLRDDENTNPDVVVLAFTAWQRHFRSDPQVLGTSVTLRDNEFDGRPFTIVGIMPPDFIDPAQSSIEFWAPLIVRASQPDATIYLGAVLGLLKPDVSVPVALEEATAIGNAITPRPTLVGEGVTGARRFEIQSLKEGTVGPIRPALRVFLAAVGVVLLIVCANVANLLLARGTARQREIGMRLAIGAGRGRIVRQLLTESLVLAAIGGMLGAVAGAAGIALIKSLATIDARGVFRLAFGGDLLPRLAELHVDLGVVGVAFTTAVLTSVIFGFVPALRLSRVDHLHLLGGRTIAGGDSRLRSVLVVGQLAMATVLLVGAGLLAHSFVKLSTVHTGYDPTNVLAFQLVLPQEYPTARKVALIETLLSRLRQVPGAEAAGFSYAGALIGIANVAGYFVPPGRTPDEMRPDVTAPPNVRSVSGDYLHTIGVALLAGRTLNDRDDANAPLVVLINRTVARQYFGDASPVGAVMTWHGRNVVPMPVEIVGVVDDVRQGRRDQEAAPQIFVDYRQMLALQQRWGAPTTIQEFLTLGVMSFAVRAAGDPAALAPAVASTIASVDPNAGIDSIAPMDRLVASSIARPRFYVVLVSVFAAIAALLAAVGVYGVLAFAVVQRTPEIGVRMALGAERRAVMGLILGKGLVLAGLGILAGLCGAAVATRYLQSMLYGVTPLDPITYAAVAALFALVALVASYLPARRATTVDPMIALRCE